MSYNEVLFEEIYTNCIGIIQNSNDRNIKNKEKVFAINYDKVKEIDDCNVQEFFAIAHELKTYEMLKGLKLDPIASNDNKPGVDFICKLGNVECVTFTQPMDEESQKTLKGNMNRYKAYEPRVSQAIMEKFKKFKDYLIKNKIDKTKPNIICLNAGICNYDIFSTTFLTACEKILFGLGFETLLINRETNEEFWCRAYEKTILNHNGKEIEINLFNKDDFCIISGVLLIINRVDEKYSKPILFINPKAKVKIDKRKTKKILCLQKKLKSTYIYSCNGITISPRSYRGII